MTHERFIEEVMQRAGFQQAAMAALAIDAALQVLGERLPRGTARELAAQLPESLAGALRRGPHGGVFSREELYARVAEREGVRLGFAVEHAQVVLQVLAEAAPADALTLARQELPAPLAELLTPRAPSPPPPTRASRPRSRRTLSDGRPGSEHPLDEAGQELGAHGLAQRRSIARGD